MTRPDDRTNKRQENLVRSILDRTSGTACNRALALLPGLVEDELDQMDRTLVQGHLEHCAGCRSVALVLGWLGDELSTMAELDPGPEFTSRILARTSKSPAPGSAGDQLTGAAGLMDRAGRWWESKIRRPVFALQAAYALTVLLVVLTTLPPLHSVPGTVLNTVQAGPASLPWVGRVIERTDQRLDLQAATLSGKIQQHLDSVQSGVQGDVAQRLLRTADDRRALVSNVAAMVTEARHGDFGPVGWHMLNTARTLRQFWRHWWRLDISKMRTSPERRSS